MARYTITNPPMTLTQGDIVEFSVKGQILEYRVMSEHLSCFGQHNDRIFELLGMSAQEKRDMASAAYGYDHPYGKVFPEYRSNDYAAAVRIVWAIYAKIATMPKEEPKPRPKVGDRVKVLSRDGDRSHRNVGRTGAVCVEDESRQPFKVYFNSCEYDWFFEGDLEVLSESAKIPEFRVAEPKPEPHVTTFELKQDGPDVNIVASRNGRKELIAYISPMNGKGSLKMMAISAADLDALNLNHGGCHMEVLKPF